MATELRKAKTPDHIDIYQKHDPYLEWVEAEGVKLIREYVFEDLSAVELGPWSSLRARERYLLALLAHVAIESAGPAPGHRHSQPDHV